MFCLMYSFEEQIRGISGPVHIVWNEKFQDRTTAVLVQAEQFLHVLEDKGKILSHRSQIRVKTRVKLG